MSKLPKFESYGNYSSDNYGVHSLVFTIGDFNIYFSYKTPIAYQHPRTGLVCRNNEWGKTTGKHLNILQPDKKKRISGNEFERNLKVLTIGLCI